MTQESNIDIEHILDIAAMMFAEIGYDGVSMRQIAKASNAPLSSIYYHFPSKQSLFEEAFSYKLEETAEELQQELSALNVVEDRINLLVDVLYRLFRDNQVLLLLMERDILSSRLTDKPMLSHQQYTYFSGVIRQCASDFAGWDIGEHHAFTVGSLIFGYCELAHAARRSNPALKSVSDPELLNALQSSVKNLISSFSQPA